MSTFLPTQSLYYDQVNLIAQPQCGLRSRGEVPEELERIIVSPMAAVVGEKFAIAAIDQGLTICLHRFDSVSAQKKILYALYDKFGQQDVQEWLNVWVAVGLHDWERVKALDYPHILIDLANGYLEGAVQFAKELQENGYSVMVGNVHSAKGLNQYRNCLARIGIGNGAPCKTGQVTGYNRGQVTEIVECVRDRNSSDQKIVADGGIKGSSEAAKAFGLGADYVMMGGYWKAAEEAQNVIDGEYRYWGGASAAQMSKQGKAPHHVEGSTVVFDKKQIKPLSELTKDLWDGISSAVSYSGYQNLTQFIGNGVFEVKA